MEKSNWESAVREISEMPANVDSYVADTMRNHPERVTTKSRNGDIGWYVMIPHHTYEVELIVEKYQKRDDRILGIVWNPRGSNAFVRDFVAERNSLTLSI